MGENGRARVEKLDLFKPDGIEVHLSCIKGWKERSYTKQKQITGGEEYEETIFRNVGGNGSWQRLFLWVLG